MEAKPFFPFKVGLQEQRGLGLIDESKGRTRRSFLNLRFFQSFQFWEEKGLMPTILSGVGFFSGGKGNGRKGKGRDGETAILAGWPLLKFVFFLALVRSR